MRIVALTMLLVQVAGCYCSHTRDEDAGRDAGLDGALPDAGRDTPPDPPRDVPPFDAGPACFLAAPNANLSGMSPMGLLRFDYGYAGLGNTSKACFGLALHWTDTDTIGRFEQPSRQLYVWLPRPSAEPILGLHRNVTAVLIDGTTTLMSNMAEVEVTAYTRDDVDPAVEATIRIVDMGWDLSGALSAPYCVAFQDPCI